MIISPWDPNLSQGLSKGGNVAPLAECSREHWGGIQGIKSHGWGGTCEESQPWGGGGRGERNSGSFLGEFEATLGYIRICLQNKTKEMEETW